MKTVIKTSIGGPFLRPYFILTAIALGFFAFSPGMQAVVPAPDGGYPGGNTAEGQDALLSLTTGDWNTAIGFETLRSDVTGQFNTGVGAGTLYFNTGNQNTASGAFALFSNTTGQFNTATGAFALEHNSTGQNNTAIGASALQGNTTGYDNTATGLNALFHNTTGIDNTANGSSALQYNTTGGANTAAGFLALRYNTAGSQNTAVGDMALENNTNGANTATGFEALINNTTGAENTATGDTALLSNTSGCCNTATGFEALVANTTGTHNIALGYRAGNNVTTANNVICIGAAGNNVSNSCYIGNIFGSTSSNGVAVLVNSNGRLGTMTSSARFKEAIKPMDKASEAILALRPVSFRYKNEIDSQRIPQFGLVAEDVEKVNPDLIVRDKEGKPYSVRYDQVNAMLLNEFLKEHKAFLEEQTKVQNLEAALHAVDKRLNEQEANIQKVRVELDVNKSATSMVFNNQ